MLSMPFKKILVPYDASEFSNNALKVAIEVAENMNAQILILHVVPSLPISNKQYLKTTSEEDEVLTFSSLLKEKYQGISNKINSVIDEKVDELNKAKVAIKTELKIGTPANTILQYVEEHSIDLIIIGSKGASGISKITKGLGLGSVSREISEKASCPIMIIR
ncbi:MAG: universal stress protein [Thermoproteota archaeon]|nr:universal stress protein [Thermoproteota archaeon]